MIVIYSLHCILSTVQTEQAINFMLTIDEICGAGSRDVTADYVYIASVGQ